jgi:hypothetical protein
VEDVESLTYVSPGGGVAGDWLRYRFVRGSKVVAEFLIAYDEVNGAAVVEGKTANIGVAQAKRLNRYSFDLTALRKSSCREGGRK